MRSPRLLAAALLLSISAVSVLASGASAAPTARDRATAKSLAADGKKALREKRWADAIAALKKADRLDPSPALALDLAQAQIGGGKLVEAEKTLSPVVEGTDAPSRRARDAAKKALADLQARVPTVKVKVSGAPAGKATTLIDGIEVDGAEEIPVNPGDHTVGVAAEGFVPAEKDVHLAEGARERVTLKLLPREHGPEADATPEKKSGSGSRTPGIVVTTLGGVGLLVGGVFGGLAFSATSSAKSQCSGNVCPASATDEIARSKTYGNVSTGGFIAGGALAVTGIVLLIAAPGGSAKSDDGGASGASARLTRLPLVTPWVGPNGGGLGATGSF